MTHERISQTVASSFDRGGSAGYQTPRRVRQTVAKIKAPQRSRRSAKGDGRSIYLSKALLKQDSSSRLSTRSMIPKSRYRFSAKIMPERTTRYLSAPFDHVLQYVRT